MGKYGQTQHETNRGSGLRAVFSDDTAPYPPDEVKRVLKIATEDEIVIVKGENV